jgi:hypothetical protein
MSRPASSTSPGRSGTLTYNFDPDRWYERERSRLELEHLDGRLGDAELESALAALEERYEEMVDRLDGTFQIPQTS